MASSTASTTSSGSSKSSNSNTALEGFSQHEDILVQELIQQVERALVLLDEDLVHDYRQAVALAPQLVQRECKLRDFLNTENHHPLLAAKRVALYWKTRKQLFGPDRWLRPLHLTAHGTLTQQQIDILNTGFHIVLTEPQAVFVSDLSRFPPHISEHFQPQIIFYLLSVSTCPMVQTGLTILHVVQDGYRPLILPRAPMLKQISEAVPVRIQQILVAQTVPQTGKEHLLEYRAYEQRRICDVNTQEIPADKRAPVDCISADTQEQMLTLLQAKGLEAAVLPSSLGGTYDYDTDFAAWIRTRQQLERHVEVQQYQQQQSGGVQVPVLALTAVAASSASSAQLVSNKVSDVSLDRSSPNNTSVTSFPDQQQQQSQLVTRAPGESAAAFRQRRNAVYAKRFTQKQKWNRVEFQVKHKVLQAQKEQLVAEHDRLQALLAQARAIVAEHAGK